MKINVEEILFVIVLYKEKLADSQSFQTITNSIKSLGLDNKKVTLYVHDNSPEDQILGKDYIWEFVYHSDISNSGLSIAYNNAALFGEKGDYKYIFLLDQDTTFPENTISTYIDAINLHTDISLFVPILKIADGRIMSPFRWSMKWGKFLDEVHPGIYSLDDTAPVNSGLCVQLSEFWKVGGYNEKVKVDGADTQFIERFKRHNNKYLVLDVLGFQDFSIFEKDIKKLTTRFDIFLKDVDHFEEIDSFDRPLFFILKIKRTLRLTYETKKMVFIKMFLKNVFHV